MSGRLPESVENPWTGADGKRTSAQVPIAAAGSKRVVIDKSEDGKNSICSAVSADCLQLVKSTSSKSVDELAREVINGKWGNGSARKKKLTAAGYDYGAVQKRVNELMK